MAFVELGLGLLSIGRRWGVNNVLPPNESSALTLLETAYSHGVRFFDTAPAYADSETILGRALLSGILPRDQVIIATKMGEHWNAKENIARADHSYDELARSIDNSIELLGRIDLLQLHKANSSNVVAPDVLRALDRAISLGIKGAGASVSDLETANLACKSGRYQYLQFPFNMGNRSLEPIFELLMEHDMKAIVNRPFAMGALIQDSEKPADELFSFIISMGFSGVILTGTQSVTHLLANIAAFRSAVD
jgi:aryl-alcohol dehydrogenase-like predicted oxidoreductase